MRLTTEKRANLQTAEFPSHTDAQPSLLPAREIDVQPSSEIRQSYGRILATRILNVERSTSVLCQFALLIIVYENVIRKWGGPKPVWIYGNLRIYVDVNMPVKQVVFETCTGRCGDNETVSSERFSMSICSTASRVYLYIEASSFFFWPNI